MGIPAILAPRDLPDVVRDVLRLIAHEGSDSSDQRLARWRTDPEIVALLSSLGVLDLSTLNIFTSQSRNHMAQSVDSFIEKNNFYHLLDSFIAENNLSHLFGCTPNLTALDLSVNRKVKPYRGRDTILDAYRADGFRDLLAAIGRLTCLQSLGLRGLYQGFIGSSEPSVPPETPRTINPSDRLSVHNLIGALLSLPHLTALDLRANDFGSEDVLAGILQPLAGLEVLKLFEFEDSGQVFEHRERRRDKNVLEMGQHVCNALQRMTALKRLHLVGVSWPDPDRYTPTWPRCAATALATALRGLTQLEELHLQRNVFCGDGANSVAGTLQRMTRLTELKMGFSYDWKGNSLTGPEAAAALTAPLCCLTSLTTLQPYEANGCSLATIMSLSNALTRNPNLTYLDMGGYNFGGGGASALAGALRTLTKLRTLDLGTNSIGPEGATWLAPALQNLTALRDLNLGQNSIGARGACEVASALYSLSMMTALHLDYNGLMIADKDSPPGLKMICASIASMSNLTRLELCDQGLHFNDQHTLGEALNDVSKELGMVLQRTNHLSRVSLPSCITCGPHMRSALLGMESLSSLHFRVSPSDVEWGLSIPSEVLDKGWLPTLAYIRELSTQGAVPCSMLRLLIVGMGEAGKTCLQRALFSENGLTTEIPVDDRTIAIDTHDSWKPDGDKLDFTVWDFAGQPGYQAAHSAFISERCLSMLVFRPDKGESAEVIFQDWVKPWIELLHAHAPGAHFLLVCTRWQSPPDGEDISVYQQRMRSVSNGVWLQARDLVKSLNRATEVEVKKLQNKERLLATELQRVKEQIQTNNVVPRRSGGHGERTLKSLKDRELNLEAQHKATSKRRKKLCRESSGDPNQMQLLTSDGTNGVYLVDSINGEGDSVISLRDAIVTDARKLPFFGQDIPRGWLKLKDEMNKLSRRDPDILVSRRDVMRGLSKAPALNSLLQGRAMKDRIFDGIKFWDSMGFALITPDQSHVVLHPPKLIDLLKPLVHHVPFEQLEHDGRASTVVKDFYSLVPDVQSRMRKQLLYLSRKYILDTDLFTHLKFWADLEGAAREQALQILCDLHLVVHRHGGGNPTETSDRKRFLCMCRLHSSSAQPEVALPVNLSSVKLLVTYAISPILPPGLFPRFLAAQIVAHHENSQKQWHPRITPSGLYMRVTSLGNEQEMLARVRHGSPTEIDVHCTSLGLLRDACCTLESTVNDLFPGLSLEPTIHFPYKDKGTFMWRVSGNMTEGYSFGDLLKFKRWSTCMDLIEPNPGLGDAVENERLKAILEPTLGLKAPFFVSHCWRDKSRDLGQAFVDMLEDASREVVWYDSQQLADANHFDSKMQRGIQQAECIVIFLSRVYLTRKNCLQELKWAWEQHKLRGKKLFILPVESAVTVDSVHAWATPDRRNLEVHGPADGGPFTIHHETLAFISNKLTAFKFREGWSNSSTSDAERWRAVQEIVTASNDMESQDFSPKRAILECRQEEGIWLLKDLGEEDPSLDDIRGPVSEQVNALFCKHGLNLLCEKICSKLGVSTLADFKLIQDSYESDLKLPPGALLLGPAEEQKMRSLVQECVIMVEQTLQSAGEKRARSPHEVADPDQKVKQVRTGQGSSYSVMSTFSAADSAVVGTDDTIERYESSFVVDPELRDLFEQQNLGQFCIRVCEDLDLCSIEDLEYVKYDDLSQKVKQELESKFKKVKVGRLKSLLNSPTSKYAAAVTLSGINSRGLQTLLRIESFFCKKNIDKESLDQEIEAIDNDTTIDNDEKQRRRSELLEDKIEKIDVHGEAEALIKCLGNIRRVYELRPHPQPTFQTFTECMQKAREENVCSLHLSGHGQSKHGFLWLKQGTTDYEKIPVKRVANLLKTESVGGGGTIESAFLNFCESEKMGKELRVAGVCHVLCWRSEVEDATAHQFALDFYQTMHQHDPSKPRDYALYKLAFDRAVNKMNDGLGIFEGSVGNKYRHDGARDYVCLLSVGGDLFPNTGKVLK